MAILYLVFTRNNRRRYSRERDERIWHKCFKNTPNGTQSAPLSPTNSATGVLRFLSHGLFYRRMYSRMSCYCSAALTCAIACTYRRVIISAFPLMQAVWLFEPNGTQCNCCRFLLFVSRVSLTFVQLLGTIDTHKGRDAAFAQNPIQSA